MRPRSLAVALVGLIVLSAGCLSSMDPGEALGEGNVSPTNDEGNRSQDDVNRSDDAGNGSDDRDRTSPPSNGSKADNGTANGSEPAPDEHPPWPAPGEASVRPGVKVRSSAGQCTSNFLFRTPDNASLMLGLAAHCFAGSPDAGDGCDPAVEPLEPGAEATISGANGPGTLVYSSWWTMQQTNESGDAACLYNDFALVEIDASDRGAVSPAVLHFGGPTGVASAGSVGSGEKVIWYGNSGTRPPSDTSHRNEGYVVSSGSRSATIYSITPGIPGDSGSGIMNADGEALAVLSTVRLAPGPGSNGIALLETALTYAGEHAGVQVDLVTWEQFDRGRLPG